MKKEYLFLALAALGVWWFYFRKDSATDEPAAPESEVADTVEYTGNVLVYNAGQKPTAEEVMPAKVPSTAKLKLLK